jgi:tetratricopeptide (TPR) repeat protein
LCLSEDMLHWVLSLILTITSADLETGKALRLEGRLQEAIEHFGQLLAAQPGLLEARLERAHTLVLAGRYEKALDDYRVLGSSPDPRWQLESAKWVALTYLYLGKIDESLSENDRLARLAARLQDRAAEVHAKWYRGHILTELRRFGEANDAFLEALEMAPDDLNTLHMAGVMAARQGDEGSLRYQIEDLQQAVEDTGDPLQMRRVYHLQAEVALLQERPQRALSLAQEAAQLFPHPLYRDAVARSHLMLDDPAGAESAYRDIVEAADERLDIPLYYIKALLGLGKTLDAQGKAEEAVTYYEKFLSLWGNAPGQLPWVSEAKARVADRSR